MGKVPAGGKNLLHFDPETCKLILCSGSNNYIMSSLAQIIGGAIPIFAWAPKGYRAMMKLSRYKRLSMAGVRSAVLDHKQLNWPDLFDVNEGVNRSAMYVADLPGKDVWGPWRLVNGKRVGDCEDYAVHKLQRLAAMGYPRGALRLAVCRVGPKQIPHCVLLVYLDDGDAIIMDNRTEGLWRKSGSFDHTWVSEEWPGRGFWWRKLK